MQHKKRAFELRIKLLNRGLEGTLEGNDQESEKYSKIQKLFEKIKLNSRCPPSKSYKNSRREWKISCNWDMFFQTKTPQNTQPNE